MTLRPATLDDAAAIEAIHRAANFLPLRNTAEENLRFAREMMRDNQTWVAEADGEVVGYVVFNDDWVRHVFVRPDRQGQGYGATLLAHAMADRRERQLWTYEGNARARRFYETRGWGLVERTDGQGTEENEPEVRYLWRP
jgi:GNAT superfamily N-acetyltransferase